MSCDILVDAVFINKGGGAVLLQYLIETILKDKDADRFFFLLDPRFDKPAALQKNFAIIPNKISERIKYYKQHKAQFGTVFCFANTPPPVRMRARSYTYFHNQKLLEAPAKKFTKMFASQYVKYLYVKLFNRNTDYYIVQTPHMVDMLLGTGLKKASGCLTIPFYDSSKYAGGGQAWQLRPKDEFVFISNPSPQKNYPTLLDAWDMLLQRGETPILHVTIDDTAPALTERVRQMNERGARIVNHVYVDPRGLYFNCRYLIFPSLMESFGLPLIEAAESGMKILASDLPFVYDVVTPSLTFDQNNALAIADAVSKAMTTDTLPMPQVVTKNEVLKLVALLTQK
jgi:glycosyltransferase involved in cell wall biosynthesis